MNLNIFKFLNGRKRHLNNSLKRKLTFVEKPHQFVDMFLTFLIVDYNCVKYIKIL